MNILYFQNKTFVTLYINVPLGRTIRLLSQMQLTCIASNYTRSHAFKLAYLYLDSQLIEAFKQLHTFIQAALHLYTVKLQWKRDRCKKCTLYKYLPYTVQCRNYSKKTVNQLYIYSTVLGVAIKSEQYSEITVESGTHVKSVKITLNIFAVYQVRQLVHFGSCDHPLQCLKVR